MRRKALYLFALLILLGSFMVPMATSDDGYWSVYHLSLEYCGGAFGGCYRPFPP